MWNKININKNQIKVQTSKAVLINCPHNSKYDGYSFWISSKLLRNGKHSSSFEISFTDDFTFNLIKYGKGKYNQSQKIDERQCTANDIKEVFGITDNNISSPIEKNEYETYVPAKKEAIDSKVNEELLDA